MMTRSRQCEAAGTAQRQALPGAGQALLATFEGTAFHVSYVLGEVAGVLVAWAMLRHGVFSRTTAWLLLVGNVVGFAFYLPVVGLVLSAFSGLVLWVWFGFMARDLLGMARIGERIVLRPATC